MAPSTGLTHRVGWCSRKEPSVRIALWGSGERMGQVAVPQAPAPLCSVLVLPALAPDLACLWLGSGALALLWSEAAQLRPEAVGTCE